MQSSHTVGRTATKAFFERQRAARAIASATPAALAAGQAALSVAQAAATPHPFGSTFLREYTTEQKEAILASQFVVLDAETTGLTPYSKPISVGASAKIGPDHTWSHYKKLHEGASIDCKVRMRVWSVQLSDGLRLAWNLDALSPDRIKDLLRDTIHDRIIIGHNVAFDLTWAVHYAGRDLKPALTLDTMLLARCLKPASVWNIHYKAAAGNESAQELINGKAGNGSVSLAALSVGLNLGTPDKSWQHPRNWAISPLSKGHYDYVLGDIDTPLELVYAWGRSRNFSDAVTSLRNRDTELGSTYFDVYEKVPLALAKISHTGVPVHVPTLDAVIDYRQREMPALIETVIQHMPGMEEFRHKLEARAATTIEDMKHVLAAYAAANGCKLDESEDGVPVINSEHANLRGASKLPGWVAWDRLQHAKTILALATEYQGISEAVDAEWLRLHPLLSASTATCRLASKVPNVMNLPKPQRMPESFGFDLGVDDRKAAWNGLQFRAVVRAPVDHVLLSADYGQIELRIAAALALRAIDQCRSVLRGDTALPESKKWVIEGLRRGEDLRIELCTEGEGFDALRDGISAAWRSIVTTDKRPMADGFKKGLDPHLLTGLTLASRQGLIDLEGLHPIDYLAAKTKDEAKALAKQFNDQRQSAKALNFGLLYGMQAEKLHVHGQVDYGLDWSLEDAQDSRAAWFELFPEIRFLQTWTTFGLMPAKKEAEAMYRRNPYSKKVGVEQVRIGCSSTLRGRPVAATEAREVLNYSDQGTGADMLLEAVTQMNAETFDCVIDLIHDEILLCVPVERVTSVKTELERCMRGAADRVLSRFGIPSEAEGDQMAFWRKD